MQFGFRKIEALIVALVLTIFGCFALNVFWAKPDLGGIARGLVTPSLPDNFALLTAVGILGATVMPHNLYLHSAIVQTRANEQTSEGKREAIRASTVDTIVSLGFAFFVNAGILILAAAVFFPKGVVVDDLAKAHKLLTPMLGGTSAVLFALALLCSGQSSTVTGTLAGQIVMEGFMRWRIAPWLRRLITRALAIVPALLIVQGGGAGKTAELLTLTQVALSMQLPFAIIPLIMFTSDRAKMGEFTSAGWTIALAIISALLIIGLNVYLLYESFGPGWIGVGIAVMLAFAAWVKWGYKPRPAA
jgi:manganese transport protein